MLLFMVAKGSFDLPTYGLLAQHASTAPLCYFMLLFTKLMDITECGDGQELLTETPFFVSMSAICFFDSIHPVLLICLFSTISFTIPISILRHLSDTYLDDFKASTKDWLSVINSIGRLLILPK